MSAVNRAVIGSISAEDTDRFPRGWQKTRGSLPVLQPGLPERQHRPVDAADLQRHVTGQDLSGSTG